MAKFEMREKDPFSPIIYNYPDLEVLHQETSPYQGIGVYTSPYFGKILTLDGVVQITERDEFFYHEMIVHPALYVHDRPENVLIIGGGDGGSLREVLKHDSVLQVTMAEIDQRVIEVSKQYFPNLSSGFSDPRATIVKVDGVEIIRESDKVWDVIIVDSTDPVGSAKTLFTREFYSLAFEALKPDGIIVSQTESLLFHAPFVREIQLLLREHFPIVDCYAQAIATYAGNWWTFSIGSKSKRLRTPKGKIHIKHRYYSYQIHRKAFLDRGLYERLLNENLNW